MERGIQRRRFFTFKTNGYYCSLLLFVIAVGISHGNGQTADNGNLKDITFARPKHLRYPSYKSFHQNGTNLNERLGLKMDHRSSEELDSEESRSVHIEQSKQQQQTQGKSSRKATPTVSNNNGTVIASSVTAKEASSNLKRSLLPAHPDLHSDSKSGRFGSPLGIQKTPPDLQFGLAFTVPFVSLSTDKLINTFSGKSHNGHDVSSILKLNLGGLLAAVVVGIAAFLFIPGLLSPGKFGGLGGGGWGGSILDSILPQGIPGIIDHFVGGGGHGHYPPSDGDGWPNNEDHIGNRPFGYQDYYEYNGVHNHNRKDTSAGILREKSGRREGRHTNGTSSSKLFGNLMSTVTKYAKKYITTAEECLQLQICRKGAADNTTNTKDGKNKSEDEESMDLIGLVESLSHNDLVKGSPLSEGIKKAHEYGLRQRECRKFEKVECSSALLSP